MQNVVIMYFVTATAQPLILYLAPHDTQTIRRSSPTASGHIILLPIGGTDFWRWIFRALNACFVLHVFFPNWNPGCHCFAGLELATEEPLLGDNVRGLPISAVHGPLLFQIHTTGSSPSRPCSWRGMGRFSIIAMRAHTQYIVITVDGTVFKTIIKLEESAISMTYNLCG